jgi:aspartyl-tRNA(Asn)/glutamyl-tRNA(Gln) amidotransferase subunit A
MELCDLSAHELAGMVRRREVSANEVLDSALKRISLVDGRSGSIESGDLTAEDKQKVHAFISITADLARTQANAVDKKIAAGEEAGALAGVPVSIKDIFCVRGTRSTAGSKILANFTSPYTATPVSRLESAGAIILGKVNLDEFTYGSSNESTAFKPAPRNPWNTGHVPGGSSGGSAASVAAGEAVLSLGTDTAGSIRQPASFCGVVGMKPTYGRVSRYGLIAFASSLDCPGPVARSVRDAAMMLGTIAGADPHDSTAAQVPVEDYLLALEKDVKGKRIGLSPDYFRITYPDPVSGSFQQQAVPVEMEKAVRQAAEVLSRLGAEIIEDVPMPNTRYGIPAYFVISRVEAASNLHRYDGVKYGYRTPGNADDLRRMYRQTRGEAFGLQPKLRILMGMYVSAAQYSEQYYMRALKVRSLIRQDFEDIFDSSGKYRLDALLTPTTPTTSFEMDAIYGDSVLMQYADQLTVPANHAGVPGISLPAGFDAQGLPIGIQLLGPDFSEGSLLNLAHRLEMETQTEAWRKMRPAVVQGIAE